MPDKPSSPTSRVLSITRHMAWGLVAVMLLAGVLAVGYFQVRLSPQSTHGDPSPIGGAFRLVDTNGTPVTEKDLAGRPSVIFFGFTHCPEVCPTTLLDLGRWLTALGPRADSLNVVFITVDPDRDTPEHLKEYLSSFDPRIRGFTGSVADIAAVAKAYRIFYKKIPLENGHYTMDHSSAVYLMDEDGRFVQPISWQTNDETAVERLRSLFRS